MNREYRRSRLTHAAEASGVALDIERTIVQHAVQIQVQVRSDVERQAAVRLQDDAELVVVEQRGADAAARSPCGASTADTDSVCVWLNGVTPLSRSRFVGSDTRSSWLPTT